MVLIVPTVALIDETRRRLTRRFRGQYKIVTQPTQPTGERTVYVLTQERFLDIPAERFAGTDFFAIDEFDKLDSQLHDERSGLRTRVSPAPRDGGPFYLLGPDVDDRRPERRDPTQFRSSGPATDSHSRDRVSPGGQAQPPGTRHRKVRHPQRPDRLYACSPARAREIARWLLDGLAAGTAPSITPPAGSAQLPPAAAVARAVRNGIGIHHGRMPRALAHHIVRLFNEGRLPWLIVTSTLIEGVNTIAKNMVIVDNRIGPRKLDFFTYSNIRGRSGRMFRQFVGKVIVYGEAPQRESRTVDVPAYSQDKAPLSLLIQLPWNELTAASRRRLQPCYQQQLVSVSTLRAASGIDPEAIVQMARTLHEDPQGWSGHLVWTGWPRYEHLLAACRFIFQLSGGQRRGGVASDVQLATRINLLREHKGQIRSLTDTHMRFAGRRPTRRWKTSLTSSANGHPTASPAS